MYIYGIDKLFLPHNLSKMQVWASFKCSSLCNCTAQFYAILKAVILCALDLNPQNTACFTNIGKVWSNFCCHTSKQQNQLPVTAVLFSKETTHRRWSSKAVLVYIIDGCTNTNPSIILMYMVLFLWKVIFHSSCYAVKSVELNVVC